MQIVKELQAQGMRRPTLRSCHYLLLDRRLVRDSPKAYDKLSEALSNLRDIGEFPYGVLSADAGTDKRGLLPDELECTITALRRSNIPPELCKGILKAVMIEKRGLVDYLVESVHGKIPVGSPEGMLRKEWAFQWCQELKHLAKDLGASRIQITYLGDCDTYGNKIKDYETSWFAQQGIDFKVYACEPHQLRQMGLSLSELHIDGYIALIGPDLFAERLRKHLGVRGR